MDQIQERVTLRPDGVYIWSAALDMKSEQKGYETGGRICEIFALILFLAGILFSVLSNSWQPVIYTGVLALTIVLITLGVVHGQVNMGQRRRTYRMMDSHISTGHGKKTALFEFKKAKQMVVGKNYIELTARLGAFRAYVPEEDMPFVRGYIQSRVPAECEIRFE